VENPSIREKREETASENKSIFKYEEVVIVNDFKGGRMSRHQLKS